MNSGSKVLVADGFWTFPLYETGIAAEFFTRPLILGVAIRGLEQCMM